MRTVLISLLLASAALAQEPPPKDPCEAHVDRFLELDAPFAVFEASDIGSDLKTMKNELKHAVDQHRALTDAYTRISAARCGLVSVDAKVMIGRTFEVLARKITSIPPPEALTQEQRDIFLGELASRAAPLEERAQEAFTAATRDAATLKLDSELIRLARKRAKDRALPERREAHPREAR